MSMINRDDTVLAVIDLQTKLMPVMKEPQILENAVIKFVKGIKELNIPVIVTQQYTKGLGPTKESISAALGDFRPIEKTTFSAAENPDFINVLQDLEKKNVILIGIETHICVQQTALQLLDQGYHVYIVQDCIASRKESDHFCAQNRMAASGAVITTAESVLFEILGGAKAEGFKAISALVK